MHGDRKAFWRIDPNRPLANELARAVRDESAWLCEFATGGARDHAEAIYRIRQSAKRLRALARLLRPASGEKEFKFWNTTLRDEARKFSAARDARVIVEAFETIVKKNELKDQAVGQLYIKFKKQGALPDATKVNLAAVARAVRAGVPRWVAAIPPRFSQAAARRALAALFRQAKLQYEKASVAPADAAFHELRKRIKVVRAVAELLATRKDKRITKQCLRWLEGLKSASDSLGRDHDIILLIDTAMGEARTSAAVGALIQRAARRGRKLRRAGLASAGEILKLEPAKFAGAFI